MIASFGNEAVGEVKELIISDAPTPEMRPRYDRWNFRCHIATPRILRRCPRPSTQESAAQKRSRFSSHSGSDRNTKKTTHK